MICNNQTTPSQQKKVYLCSIIAYISELGVSGGQITADKIAGPI